MARKPDIKVDILNWDHFQNKTPDEALANIYQHIGTKARKTCDWYWTSIKSKKGISLWARGVSVFLLILGTALPIFSAVNETVELRLLFTQLGIGLLVIAGLIVFSDRVFGWSSGWMRYIATVTTMENLIQTFELQWATYIAVKTGPLDQTDVKALFELSVSLEQELSKLQAEETTKWIAEFNTSISLLESMIKSQREDTDKKLEVIRTNLDNQANAAKEQEKSKLPGGLELSLNYEGAAKKFKIKFNDDQAVDFEGTTWSKINIPPGMYQIIIDVISVPAQQIIKVVQIDAGKLQKIEVKL
jgi:low affinity Fe/Cu permease